MCECFRTIHMPWSFFLLKSLHTTRLPRQYSHNIDNSYYAIAEDEIVNGNIDKGLWSKAIVNVNGNESLRKIEYIKLRARELQELQQERQQ